MLREAGRNWEKLGETMRSWEGLGDATIRVLGRVRASLIGFVRLRRMHPMFCPSLQIYVL